MMENIIIGSGPAGRFAALELGKLEKDVLLVEKNHIAGTCLNEGCMVICALTDITKFIETNLRFNNYGFIKSKIDISYEDITKKIKETQIKLRKINEMENEAYGNKILYGEAKIEGDTVVINKESYDYKKLLVATGARSNIPKIKGSKYGLTNKDILNIDKVPEKMNIIGGGILSCEVANIYSTLGSEVSIFSHNAFLKEIKDDTVKDYIKKNLLKNINIFENINVSEIKKYKIITMNNKEYEGVTFLATGRVPNSEIVKNKVELNEDNTIKVNGIMETSKKNVYAAGDVIGGINLTPVARMEGKTAARNMAGYMNKIEYDSVPQSLSLNMEVSFVNQEINTDNEKIVNLETPGIAGPGVFWNILTGDTGYTKISINSHENQIEKIASISPSSFSDVAYLSYLMRTNKKLDEFEEFLEIHPSTDANYKLIKTMWL